MKHAYLAAWVNPLLASWIIVNDFDKGNLRISFMDENQCQWIINSEFVLVFSFSFTKQAKNEILQTGFRKHNFFMLFRRAGSRSAITTGTSAETLLGLGIEE